ncbi:MAG: response regulator transcription factor, partial [Flavobacteriales bacterium]|nr:response regulator transcription factor [Flavobacteriales bacterium]
MAYNIALIDDHQIIIDGLISLLDSEPSVNIVASGNSGKEALEVIKEHNIDVLILDIHMPEMDGLELLEEVRKTNTTMKVIMLTMHDEPTFIRTSLEKGANGYMLKNISKVNIVKAIDTVMKGEYYLSGTATSRLVEYQTQQSTGGAQIVELSSRELDVIRLICSERTTEEIADELTITPNTVKSHRKKIMTKMGVRNIAGVV